MEEGQINPIPLTFFMVLLLLHRNVEKRTSQMGENKARYIYFKRALEILPFITLVWEDRMKSPSGQLKGGAE